VAYSEAAQVFGKTISKERGVGVAPVPHLFTRGAFEDECPRGEFLEVVLSFFKPCCGHDPVFSLGFWRCVDEVGGHQKRQGARAGCGIDGFESIVYVLSGFGMGAVGVWIESDVTEIDSTPL